MDSVRKGVLGAIKNQTETHCNLHFKNDIGGRQIKGMQLIIRNTDTYTVAVQVQNAAFYFYKSACFFAS